MKGWPQCDLIESRLLWRVCWRDGMLLLLLQWLQWLVSLCTAARAGSIRLLSPITAGRGWEKNKSRTRVPAKAAGGAMIQALFVCSLR